MYSSEPFETNGWDVSKIVTGSNKRSRKEHMSLISKTTDTLSFVVIRNPFDRLVSAYRNKIECGGEQEFEAFSKSLVRDYRVKGIQIFGRDKYNTSAGLMKCR